MGLLTFPLASADTLALTVFIFLSIVWGQNAIALFLAA